MAVEDGASRIGELSASLDDRIHSNLGAPDKSSISVRGLHGMDVFFAFNIALFLLMCVFAYYARWTKYAGNGHIAVAEFMFYAVVIILAITALWAWLRRYALPAWLLVIIEFGILIHFAGGLVHFGGARLYDHIYFGIRYDKYVHFTNAFFAALTVQEIFRIKNVPINAFTRFAIYLVALGLGSGIEICEYVATLTIPHNGVGGYDDTMTDLIANSCGGALFLALRGRIPGFRRQHPVQATECQP